MDTRRATKVPARAAIYNHLLIHHPARPLAVVLVFFLLGIVSSSLCRQYHFIGVALAAVLLIWAVDSTEGTIKADGKVMVTGSVMISRDGRALTYTAKSTNAEGEQTNAAEVFEPQ